MRTFNDSNGRQWQIKIDCAAIARVYDQFQIDLGDPTDGDIPLHVRLLTGAGMLLKLLPVVCAGQLAARGLTAEAFLDSIPPKLLKEVRRLFLEEWQDFFRESGDSQALKVIQMMDQLVEARRGSGTESPEVKKIEALLASAFQKPSPAATTSPESAA